MIISGQDFGYGSASSSISNSIFNFIFYISIFIMVNVVCYSCYRQTLTQVLSCCSVAYAVQHIVKNVTDLVSMIPIFSKVLPQIAFSLVFFILMCYLLYYFFIREQSNRVNFNRKNKARLFISLLVIFICIGMSRLTSDNGGRNNISLIAESIYAITCCVLVLFVQFGFYEVETMKELLHEERKQYELSKETIDTINIKCHDLKYQIAELRKNYSETAISSIEKAVMIYDCTVKTGNDVLDVILTEKKLQCENKNIHMTCVAHGEQIEFMETMDVYTLFGNVLSNAIESVAKVKNEEKRGIGINIIDIEEMICIHIENYFEGEIKFKDGLPVTDKDKDYHGFGMKSIKRIVKKYDGQMSVSAEQGKFSVDIFMPIDRKK